MTRCTCHAALQQRRNDTTAHAGLEYNTLLLSSRQPLHSDSAATSCSCRRRQRKLLDGSSDSQVIDRVLQLLSFSCCHLQLLLKVLHLLLQRQLLGLCLQQSPLAAVALIIGATQLLLKAVVAAGITGGRGETHKRPTTRKSQGLLSIHQDTIGRALGW